VSIIDDLTEASQHLTLAEADRRQILAAAKDQAVIDGVAFDLHCDLVDAFGTRWYDTGARDSDGQPLMQSRRHPEADKAFAPLPVPLLDVYLQGAPLLHMPSRPTHAEQVAALASMPTPAEVFGGAS
jgi:hypothetical protein